MLVLEGVLLTVSQPAQGAPVPRKSLVLLPAVSVRDHPARVRILAHLRLLPGDHFRSIARTLGLSLGEARHHLNILQHQGRIREQRTNRRCRYYVVDEGGSGQNETFEKFWAYRDLRLRVLQLVRTRGKASPSDVSAALGISRQLASYHLLRLAEMGYVRREDGHYGVREPAAPPSASVKNRTRPVI